MRINQNTFRQNRSTVEQILVLGRLLGGIRSENLPAVITFIDFKKAFDSIHRGRLMTILTAYRVPGICVSAINGLTLTWRPTYSPQTEILNLLRFSSVIQVDTLAPYLFVIALDYAMRIAIGLTLANAMKRRYPATFICDVDYADDISLLSNTFNQAQQLLQKVGARAS